MNEPISIVLPAPVEVRYSAGSRYEEGHQWPDGFCVGQEDGGRGCGKPLYEDQLVRKLDGMWVHDECARQAFTQADVNDAWLLLAEQIADRPSAFRAQEIRVVMRNVAAIASRAQLAIDLAAARKGEAS